MRTRSLPSRSLSRAARVAALAGVAALGLAQTAFAVAISNLSVVLDPANTADFFDDVGPIAGQMGSSVGVVSSSATGFVTRYQEGVYTDAGQVGAATNVVTLSSSYTISFDVTDAVGSAWRLDITTLRAGAFTAVNDGAGSWALTLGALTGTNGGVGSLSSGSLDLTGIARTTGTTTADSPFNQSAVASITGSGNGTVILNFTWSAVAETIVSGNGSNAQGDEAAIRMGLGSSLTSFAAGAYPGTPPVPSRTAANDGHSVDLALIDLGPIPEPDTALLLGMGLGLLALQSRRRRAR